MPTRVIRTNLSDIYELHSEPFFDHRGSFLNVFRAEDSVFSDLWGSRNIAQVNLSKTERPAVVRGLHFQSAPYSEAKLVRCIRGRVWDVAVDLRCDSPTRGKWFATVLAPDLANALFIPEGCAHGFQVLEPDSEVLYLSSEAWVKESELGVRFDDPDLGIPWPLRPQGLSERDLALPLLETLT